MIIGHKTEAFPIPGIKIDGRELFITTRPEDSEANIQQVADYVTRALKEWAELTPNVRYTKKYNADPLRPTTII